MPTATNIRYAVGSAEILISDPSGFTPSRGESPEHPGRNLPTTLWFPVAGPPAATEQASPPIRGRFPFVVFAHGFDVTPSYYQPLLHELATHGYVVAAPLFPISGAGLPGAARENDMFRQPGDITAVISNLVMQAKTRGGMWSGVIDPSRIAIAGHSDGGETVAAMVLYPGNRDSRVSAAVIFSGRGFPPPVPAAAPIPTLVEQGLADTTNPPARALRLFDQLAHPKAFLTEQYGSHTSAVTGFSIGDQDIRASVIDFLDVTFGRTATALAELNKDGNVAGQTQLAIDGPLTVGSPGPVSELSPSH